jgi:threonine dehydratase
MHFAFEKLKLVIEPGGAVALACVLHGIAPACASAPVIVISGSNVDTELYASILRA